MSETEFMATHLNRRKFFKSAAAMASAGLLVRPSPLLASEQESLNNQNFVGIGLSNGQGGTFGMVLLYNPANSGKLLVLRRVVIAGTFPTTTAFDLRKTNSQFGIVLTNPPRTHDKRVGGGVASVAQISIYDSSSIPGTPPMHEFWIGEPNKDHTYDFQDDPFVIDPGWGIFTAAASTGGYNVTTFHWKQQDIA